jgi:methylamine--corrinoid protein Co-methyltransferase
LLDILDRASQGPVIDERVFDLEHVAGGIARVIREYEISFDRDIVIQQDDEMIDRVWEATLDFLVGCGVYHADMGRVLAYTKDEIHNAIAAAPSRVTIGEGTDSRVLQHRTVEDPHPPLVSGGPIGTPLSEDLYVPVMQSYFQEPIIDTIVPGTLATTFGREVRTKSPLEIISSWQQVDLDFEAAERAGRPGLSIMAVEMSTSDLGHLSAIGSRGYRPTDTHIVAMIGELKINNELLNKVAHSIRQDGVLLGFYNPILGGMAGPAEGVAVLITAGMVALQLVYLPASRCSCPTHPFNFNSTDPEIMRAAGVAMQALARNSHLLTELMTSPVGGPGTETVLYESLAMATVASVCGASRALGVRSAVGVVQDHVTGLEARFNGEVARAAAGLSRAEADEIVRKALQKYEPDLNRQPVGVPFSQAYDPVTVNPRPDWLAVYHKVKEQAHAWGLPVG